MRTLLKILLLCVSAVALVLVAGLLWFFYYSRDLPDTSALAKFAPTSVTSISDACLKGVSVAIPYDAIGSNLRNALNAAEVAENDPSVLTETYHAFTDQKHLHRATLSMQISRTMFCGPSKMLRRQLTESRTGEQLERHFSRRDLFTIYANRVPLAESVIGVQGASQYFFRKNPSELNIAEAAMLAGLIKSPSLHSPLDHPDRAEQRRNVIVNAMAAGGTISASEAEKTRAAPLGVVAF